MIAIHGAMISPAVARFLRYVLTGGTAAIVDVTIFTALHVAAGFGLPLAMTCSFCVAACVNYGLTSVFVFSHQPNLRQLGLFFMGAVIGYGVNLAVTLAANAFIPFARILADIASAVGLPADIARPYAATPARVCGLGVAFLFNFYLNSTVVFRSSPRPAPIGPGAA
jgi:putative flippase GtrA